MRDEELAVATSQVRNEVRGIYGAPKTFERLRALGVRTSRKRMARIMRERGWRGVTRACAKRPSGEKRASKRESPVFHKRNFRNSRVISFGFNGIGKGAVPLPP